MARNWEAQFRTWATPPGKAEEEKIERAEREVRTAVAASPALSRRTVQVFPQGSYRNRTNVPRESDVDICVLCTDSFFSDVFPTNEPLQKSVQALPDADYRYPAYKNDLEAALVAHFGRTVVKRGDKAFNIRETTYRVEADAIATFENRRYTGFDSYGGPTYITGTAFVPDSGGRTVNWPQQHYDNGVAKNTSTRDRFKAMTRVIKNLRNEMDDQAVAAAKPVPSFLLECLVWNVPDSTFGHSTYSDELKEIIRSIYLGTRTEEECSEWREVNALKYLMRGSQPWTRQQANAFALAAWQYVGYKDS
jgi:hypothetical protein